MNPIFQNLRVGKTYRLTNYGERTQFIVLRKLSEENFVVKNILSLETFELYDLVRFGRGADFDIREIRWFCPNLIGLFKKYTKRNIILKIYIEGDK